MLVAAGAAVWLLSPLLEWVMPRHELPPGPEAAIAPVRVPARPDSRVALLPSQPESRAPIPASVVRDGRPDPAFLRSYLEGRTPDEIRPDGTQVFHGMPFEVRQPDGTIRVVPVTLTVQPTDLEPLPPEPR